MPKEILHPIFLECVQYANDIFWENVFEDLSYGKAPFGTRINKNSLTCNFKDKEFNYRIEKKDAEVLYNDIYHLLTTKLGIMSQYDKIKKKIDFENIENDLKDNQKNWINIRKKNIKDLLIEKFVIDKKKEFNLSSAQSKLLLSKIFTGIIFKILKNKDIIFENGKIMNIEGISFKNKKVIYEKDFYEFENSYRKIIIIDKNLMSDNWKKYLTNLKKLVK
jgi:hypothetical protein